MNIRVKQENLVNINPEIIEYATCDLEIVIDKNMPARTKRELVTHAVIENYLPSWEHPKVDELCALIQEAIDELGLDNGSN